jgi:pimeloyl-ACP methyl ester carboxylesterase
MVLLHASPVSSASMVEDVEHFAALGAQAIAIDSPGYGESEGLGLAAPELPQYSDALQQTLEALGIGRCVLFGRHSGAAIAVQHALRHPRSVAAVYCDGYPIYDPATRARYLRHYVVRREHDWTGSHLVWYWNRYREQFIYWPWFEQRPSHRADTGLPTPDRLHQGTLDMLATGLAYGLAETAVFSTDAAALLAAVTVPVTIAARPGDSLLKRVPLLSGLGGRFSILEVPRDEAEARECAWRALAPALRECVAASSPVGDVPQGRIDRRMLDVDGDRWCLRSRGLGETGGRPLLLLPEAPGSGAVLEAVAAALGHDGPVLIPDWPGAGNSETHQVPSSIDELATRLRGLLDRLGVGVADVQGLGIGARVAARLLASAGAGFRAATPPLELAPAGALHDATPPDLTPDTSGAHLLRAWQFLRDRDLWKPADDTSRRALQPGPETLDVARLDALCVELLKQPHHSASFAAMRRRDAATPGRVS